MYGPIVAAVVTVGGPSPGAADVGGGAVNGAPGSAVGHEGPAISSPELVLIRACRNVRRGSGQEDVADEGGEGAACATA
jgi:hypothetical protein